MSENVYAQKDWFNHCDYITTLLYSCITTLLYSRITTLIEL